MTDHKPGPGFDEQTLTRAADAFKAVIADAGGLLAVAAFIVADLDGECAAAAEVDRDVVGPEGFGDVLTRGMVLILQRHGISADVEVVDDPAGGDG